MLIRNILIVFTLTITTHPAWAQNQPQPRQNEIDCRDPANAELEACLVLPDGGVTNLVPLIAPVLGVVGLGALAGGGGGGVATTSTTSTTN